MKITRTAAMTVMTLVLAVVALPAHAIERDGHRYGAGFQFVDGAPSGISGILDMDGALSAQGILGLEPFPSALGRLRLALTSDRWWDVYGAGMVGFFDDPGFHDEVGEDDIGLVIGGAFGWEADWRGIEPDLPPFSWSFELSFTNYGFGFGLGIHYTF